MKTAQTDETPPEADRPTVVLPALGQRRASAAYAAAGLETAPQPPGQRGTLPPVHTTVPKTGAENVMVVPSSPAPAPAREAPLQARPVPRMPQPETSAAPSPTEVPRFKRPDRVGQLSRNDATGLAFACIGAGWAGHDRSGLEAALHTDTCLRTPLRVTRGTKGPMADALADQGTFCDLKFFAEDAITGATAPKDICADTLGIDGAGSLESSGTVAARGSFMGVHGGFGWLGQPTGKPVRLRVMGDVWYCDGHARDAWVIRDTAGALAQIGGGTPEDWARQRITAAGAAESAIPVPLNPDSDIEGPYAGRGASSDHGDTLCDRLRGLMTGDLNLLARGDDPACSYVLPGNWRGLGKDSGALGFWAGLRSALPSAAFRIEHRAAAMRPNQAPVAAVRWSLYGRHDGPGRFGAASGVYVHVMGMTHVEFGPKGIRRDWTLIDDCAVWTQILLARGTD
jgi:hypothetical protein